MRIQRFFPLFLMFMGLAHLAVAQKYRTALGVRVGKSEFGVTMQQKLFEKVTLEGIGSVGSRDASGTLLLERHFPLLGKSFNYYLGAGAHIGALKEQGFFYGADAIVGAELRVPLFPLVVSADVKPAFHAQHENWVSMGGGFSLRYILVKDKKKDKRSGNIFRRKKEVEKKGVWPFRKKEEPPKKKFRLFGKEPEPEPEPVKKRNRIFGRDKEPVPAPEPPKRRIRLFEKKNELQPEPDSQPEQ